MKLDITALLKQFTDKHLLVVGDVMLDKYIWGSVDRISPEAPVPVVHVNKTNHHSGGAANVARNIHGLGANVTLIGLVGDDTSGQQLKSILSEDEDISCKLLIESGRQTTVKTRIIAQGQQVVRLDRENHLSPTGDTVDMLKQVIAPALASVDGIILQDYNKGVFTPELIQWIMEQSRKNSIHVYVDPKKHHFAAYSGARLFKPNVSEFFSNVNDESELDGAGESFRNKHGFDILMVTQGEKGMTLFTADKPFQIETKARAVHDVSGAGDTVIATFALSDVCGCSPEEAARISNLAAGRVCEEVGVVPIDTDSLLDIVNHHHD